MKYLSFFAIILSLYAAIVGIPLRAAAPDPLGTLDTVATSKAPDAVSAGYKADTDIETIVGTAITALLSLLGTIFLGLVVYGGFVWMQAKGDENEIKRAQGMIRNGIIGMAIIIFAYAIAYFVIFRLQNVTILATPATQTP